MSLTKRAIKAAKPKRKEYTLWDDAPRGLGLRVTPNGSAAFIVLRRLKGQKLIKRTIGTYPEWSLKDAREEAGKLLRKITKGVDPKAEEEQARKIAARRETGNFDKVADDFLKRHVRASGLRTADDIERQLNAYIRPEWGARHIDEIRRSDVVALLDKIEDGNLKPLNGKKLKGGKVTADRVLALVRKLFNWYAVRNDDFVPPIAKGMARTKPKERARERVLTDEELRALWPVWGSQKPAFGPLMQFLLLTGQRRQEAAGMTRKELTETTINGKLVTLWTIPGERHKSKRAQLVPLSSAALAIIEAQPVIGKAGYIFTTAGATPFSGFSKLKADCDKLAKVTGWRIHDLRRTAKTLMKRGGISGDVSERVLGHAIAGVEGVYDRYDYQKEKQRALRILALVVQGIVRGRTEPPKRAFMGSHLERTDRLALMGRRPLSAVA